MKKLLAVLLIVCIGLGIGGVSVAARQPATTGSAALGRSLGLGDWHSLDVQEDSWYRFEWIYGSMGRISIISLANEQVVHEFTLGRFQRTAVVFLPAGAYAIFVPGRGYYELRVSQTEEPPPTFWQRWGNTITNVIAGAVVVGVIVLAAYVTFSAMD